MFMISYYSMYVFAHHVQGIHGGDLLSIPNVVTTSAGMCDIDIRPVMGYTHTYMSLIVLHSRINPYDIVREEA